jgi:hypothetical protein
VRITDVTESSCSLDQANPPVTAPSPINAERRSTPRYPLRFSVMYRVLRRGGNVVGAGYSLNISHKGLFVIADHQGNVRVGAKLEASLEWPVLLDGRVALRLVTTGSVVRSDKNGFAVSFQKHEFRTAKHRPESIRLAGTLEQTATPIPS